MNTVEHEESVAAMMDKIGRAARRAAQLLATSSAEARDSALLEAAAIVRREQGKIISGNRSDMEAARQRGLSDAMLDRLALNPERIEAIAAAMEAVARLPQPVGRILAEWERPNGLRIQRIAVPLGVVGIIYESRPNVTADAAALCLKSGNAVILRGGSESFNSNHAIYECLIEGLERSGIPAGAIQLVPTTNRAAVGYLLSSMAGFVDVVVPRGGKGLVARVQADARVPVIGHLEGICHVYLHGSADPEMAQEIVLNAKMRRTGICGAAETVLIDKLVAGDVAGPIVAALTDAGCEVRGDESIRSVSDQCTAATDADWSTEYLDAIVSMRVVDDIDGAIQHIGQYGSGHTECIVAEDDNAVTKFFAEVDSAIVLHNASTQFADGGEFGMGGEIGISTGKIHARGPVGAAELTSYKYVVHGSGQVRP